jgi:hypothetical protein
MAVAMSNHQPMTFIGALKRSSWSGTDFMYWGCVAVVCVRRCGAGDRRVFVERMFSGMVVERTRMVYKARSKTYTVVTDDRVILVQIPAGVY